jgi:hypothetical protein
MGRFLNDKELNFCRPPAYAASYDEINDFLGKGHYKKLYQEKKYILTFGL